MDYSALLRCFDGISSLLLTMSDYSGVSDD
jgi:hypothetical protein